jgi:hypothetical protein
MRDTLSKTGPASGALQKEGGMSDYRHCGTCKYSYQGFDSYPCNLCAASYWESRSKEEMRDCLEYIRKGLQPLFERVATLEGKVEILTTTNRPSTPVTPETPVVVDGLDG